MNQAAEPNPIETHPVEHLVGRTLERGWTVVEKLVRAPGASGGCFSVGYIAKHESGKKAFVKALDYSRALQSEDVAKALLVLTEAYEFEKAILRICNQHGLDRIAQSIDAGTTRVPEAGIIGAVSYLLFDMADRDLRSQIDLDERFDEALRLRVLHQIAAGLWQLHKHDIAHQDLKPSNVLVFEGKDSKIADLGRAAAKGIGSPHANAKFACQLAYAPIESVYGHSSEDWHIKRQGCDLYQLGSMIVFLFAGSSMTAELMREIPPSHHPSFWRGSYQEALPVVQMAFANAVKRIKDSIAPALAPELGEILIQLCNPDVTKRGNPKRVGTNSLQYSMETYITKFNRLATKAEMILKEGVSNS